MGELRRQDVNDAVSILMFSQAPGPAVFSSVSVKTADNMKPRVIQAFDMSLLQVSVYFLMLIMDALTSLGC